MNSLIAIQGWLYNGMASMLGEVVGGDMLCTARLRPGRLGLAIQVEEPA
jgi:hypothetical protein